MGTPSQTIRAGALTTSVGRSRVGNGVSVNVAAGMFVAAGVEVAFAGTEVAVERSVATASGDWAGASVGASVAAGSSVAGGASVAAAAGAQEVTRRVISRSNMIRRLIQTLFQNSS